MYLCTCHTDRCENADVGIPMQLDVTLDDGTSAHTDTVICGVCSEPITDITPAPAP